jgi:hypothetical protein
MSRVSLCCLIVIVVVAQDDSDFDCDSEVTCRTLLGARLSAFINRCSNDVEGRNRVNDEFDRVQANVRACRPLKERTNGRAFSLLFLGDVGKVVEQWRACVATYVPDIVRLRTESLALDECFPALANATFALWYEQNCTGLCYWVSTRDSLMLNLWKVDSLAVRVIMFLRTDILGNCRTSECTAVATSIIQLRRNMRYLFVSVFAGYVFSARVARVAETRSIDFLVAASMAQQALLAEERVSFSGNKTLPSSWTAVSTWDPRSIAIRFDVLLQESAVNASRCNLLKSCESSALEVSEFVSLQAEAILKNTGIHLLASAAEFCNSQACVDQCLNMSQSLARDAATINQLRSLYVYSFQNSMAPLYPNIFITGLVCASLLFVLCVALLTLGLVWKVALANVLKTLIVVGVLLSNVLGIVRWWIVSRTSAGIINGDVSINDILVVAAFELPASLILTLALLLFAFQLMDAYHDEVLKSPAWLFVSFKIVGLGIIASLVGLLITALVFIFANQVDTYGVLFQIYVAAIMECLTVVLCVYHGLVVLKADAHQRLSAVVFWLATVVLFALHTIYLIVASYDALSPWRAPMFLSSIFEFVVLLYLSFVLLVVVLVCYIQNHRSNVAHKRQVDDTPLIEAEASRYSNY